MATKEVKVLAVVLTILFVLTVLMFAPPSYAASETIFFDDFNTGYSGWNASGDVASDNSPAIVPNSARLKKVGTIWRTVSTVGYSNISVTWNMAAQALETGDYCYVEVNSGSGWTAIASLTNGQDTSVFYSGTVNLGSEYSNNPNFQIRYRDAGNALGDYCYAEDTTIAGTSGAATSTPTNTPQPTNTPGPTPTPGPGVPGDPLTGSGNVSRTVLTYSNLMNGFSYNSPQSDAAFALPANAAPPDHVFQGRLELFNEATSGGFLKIKDSYNYDADPERLHIPEFDYEFVQSGSYLIPVQRGLIINSHPYWNYIVSPGRVWKENSDNGYSRAAFPFALVQQNANCTHNGVMTFLFNDTGVSKVWYQITQETCLYFKGNYWGLLNATYHAGSVTNANQLINDFITEVNNKFPTKPFSELAVDYPGTNLTPFTSGITAEHMTTYGVVVNGVNYRGGCTTRYGTYAFCDWMRMPSYSTAKSVFPGGTLMRLEQKYEPNLGNFLIKDYLPEYTSSLGDWSSVTFNNTIDMATGNYKSALYMSDDGSLQMDDFYLAETYDQRITAALNWPHKAAPGTVWVYRTSDTFIMGRALHNYLQTQEGSNADIFNFLVDEILKPINIGPGAFTTLRTSDNNWQGQALAGYGMWFIADDVAKISNFLNVDGGAAGGNQLLHPGSLADALQQDPNNRGMATTNPTYNYMYNDGFWGLEFTTSEGYGCNFWVPFMSGYGGITIAMMPGGATYYYFSDNDEFDWHDTVQEIHNNVANNCP